MISPAAAADPGRGWIYAICNAGLRGEGVIAAIVREFRPGSERVLDGFNRGPYREAHGASEWDPRAVSAAFCDEGASYAALLRHLPYPFLNIITKSTM